MLEEIGPSLVSSALSLFGGKKRNDAAKKEAKKNRDWQERMSNTAHQREVIDLRAAGLNPILSGTGGMGASSPAGSMATVEDAYTPAAQTGINTYQASTARQLVEAQLDTQKAQAENYRANSAYALAQTETERNRPENIASDTDLKYNQGLESAESTRLKKQQGEESRQNVQTAKSLADKLDQESFRAMADTLKLNQDVQTNKALQSLFAQQGVNEKVRNRILNADVATALGAAARAKNEGEIDETTYGKVLRYIDRAVNALTPFKGSFKK